MKTRFLCVCALAGGLASSCGRDGQSAPSAPSAAPAETAAAPSAATPSPAPAAADPIAAALAADAAVPETAGATFYRTRMELKIDGLPQEWQLAGLTGTITPELYRVIDKACFAQAAFILRKTGGKPPWIEGDLFSSLFEGAKEFTVGKAAVTGTTAELPVSLIHTADGQTTKWTDHLLMRQTDGRWQVDDIRYGGTWDSAAKGTLRQTLAVPAE